MKIEQIFRNAGMASAQVVLSGGMLFALYYFLLREIGPSQLGVWSIVLATSSAVRLSELGLSGGVIRFVAKYVARQEAVKAANVVQTATVSTAIFLAVILFLLYPVVGSVLRFFIPVESHTQAMSLLPFALMSLWLLTIGGIFTSGLDGVLRTDVRSYIMTGGVAIHLALVLLLVPAYGLLGLGYSQVIQSTFVLIFSWWSLRRELPSLPLFPFRWNRQIFIEILRYGLNVQAASVAQMLFDPTTKMLLSKFGGLDSVAFFEMANRMVTQVRGLVVSANQVMVPIFSRLHEETPNQISSIYRKSYDLLIFVALPIFSAIAAMIPIVSELWIGSYQPLFVNFSYVLAVGWFLNTLNAPSYFSNMGTGDLNWNTIAHITIGVLNAVLGVVFGFLFGGRGVVLGFVIALALGSSLVVFNYHARNGIQYHELIPKKHWLLCLASLVVPTLTWQVYSNLRDQLGVSWLFSISLLLVTGTLLSVVWINPMRRQLMSQVLSGYGKSVEVRN